MRARSREGRRGGRVSWRSSCTSWAKSRSCFGLWAVVLADRGHAPTRAGRRRPYFQRNVVNYTALFVVVIMALA